MTPLTYRRPGSCSPRCGGCSMSPSPVLAAATERDGSPTVPAAHPDHWWGLLERTAPGTELHPAAEPLRLSGSAVSKVQECPLRWFLGSRVGAGGPASSAMGFGAVIHALADDVATGRCSSDIDAVMRRLDQVWGPLQFEAKWQSAQQRPVATSSARAWMTAPKPMAELAGPPAPTRLPRNHRSGHSCTLLTAEPDSRSGSAAGCNSVPGAVPLRLSGSAVSK